MNPLYDGAPWLLASCFGLSVVSALVPWFNGEAVVLSFAAMTRSPLDLALLAVLAAAGQTAGKCVLYFVGTGIVATSLSRRPRTSVPGRLGLEPKFEACENTAGVGNIKAGQRATIERWRARLRDRGGRSLALVFVSSTVGIPPLYLTTIAAGTVGMPFTRFIAAAGLGRVLRFGAVVLFPGILLHAWR